MQIRVMTIEDYDEVIALFKATPGVTVRGADSRESTAAYFKRNPGLSFVATEQGAIIGTVMCGHDGRRGYLQHLVVNPAYRGHGIGEKLFTACLDALAELGILKTHIHVLRDNDIANGFWPRKGWQRRDDIYVYSFNRSPDDNA